MATSTSTLLDDRMKELMNKLQLTTGDVRLGPWENETGTERLNMIGYGGFGEVYAQPVDNPKANFVTSLQQYRCILQTYLMIAKLL